MAIAAIAAIVDDAFLRVFGNLEKPSLIKK
jgi:hypothetical protein